MNYESSIMPPSSNPVAAPHLEQDRLQHGVSKGQEKTGRPILQKSDRHDQRCTEEGKGLARVLEAR